jgi:membrane-bound ClpP family serine protease
MIRGNGFMYIGRCVYNALSKCTRSIQVITNVFISFGIMMIPVGFLLMTTEVSRAWIWIAGIIGFTCLIWGVVRANKEDKRREEMHKELIEAIRRIGR